MPDDEDNYVSPAAYNRATFFHRSPPVTLSLYRPYDEARTLQKNEPRQRASWA
jgi:hypothetical protein